MIAAGSPADSRPFLLAMAISVAVAGGMAWIAGPALDRTTLAGHLAVALFLCSVAILLRRRVKSSGIAILCSLALLLAVSLARLGPVFWGVAAAVCVLAAVGERRRGPMEWLTIAALGAVVGAIVLSEADSPYANFMVETRLLSADVHTDSVQHMAISNMVMQAHTVSWGLHGAVPLSYHAFSHFVYGAIAHLLAVPVSSTYGLATLIVFAPLLFAALLACAGELRPDAPRWSMYGAVLMLIGFLVGFVGRPMMENCTLWHSYFVSESYLLGLVLFTAFLSYLLSGHWSIALIAVFLVLLTVTKASLGAIAGAVLIVAAGRAWRAGTQTLAHLSAVVGTAGVLSTTALLAFLPEGNVGRIEFLTFVDNYMTPRCALAGSSFGSRVAAFLVAHYAFLWLAIAAWMVGPRHSRASADTEIVVAAAVAAVVGFIPLSMAIPGGGAYYFSNVATFAALPIVLALGADAFGSSGRRGAILSSAALVAALGGAVVSGAPFVTERLRRLATATYRTDAPVAPYVRQLRHIRDDAPVRSLVYIAKGERDYWEAQPVDCTRMAVLIPAVSGLPALYGVPERACTQRVDRPYPRYDDVFEVGSRLAVAEAELCAETRRLGYEDYIDVRRTGARRVVCTP